MYAIRIRNFDTLDIKKLKGPENMYRVRIGRYRIKFEMIGNTVIITDLDNRNDNTY